MCVYHALQKTEDRPDGQKSGYELLHEQISIKSLFGLRTDRVFGNETIDLVLHGKPSHLQILSEERLQIYLLYQFLHPSTNVEEIGRQKQSGQNLNLGIWKGKWDLNHPHSVACRHPEDALPKHQLFM